MSGKPLWRSRQTLLTKHSVHHEGNVWHLQAKREGRRTVPRKAMACGKALPRSA